MKATGRAGIWPTKTCRSLSCVLRVGAGSTGPVVSRAPGPASMTVRTNSPPTMPQTIAAWCVVHLPGNDDVATLIAPPSAATTTAVEPASKAGHCRPCRRLPGGLGMSQMLPCHVMERIPERGLWAHKLPPETLNDRGLSLDR